MRLIIVAGLLMGVSLALQSAHNAKVGHVTSVDSVPASAPWYIAMNAMHGARHLSAAPLRG
jgi:hypothetical protein